MKNQSSTSRIFHPKTIGLMLFTIAIFLFIGFFIGKTTANGIYPWYAGLNKSPLTPPDVTFSIVWSLLYIILAIALVYLWVHRDRPRSRLLITLFTVQMLLNWMWAPLFFTYHEIYIALFDLVLLLLINLVLIIVGHKYHKYFVWMVLPYFLWLCFATYLNIYIVLYN